LTDYENLLEQYKQIISDYELDSYCFLVTGASGFIGRNLIEILDELNLTSIGIDIKTPTIFQGRNHMKNSFYICDLLDKKFLEKIEATCGNNLIVLHLTSPLINKSSINIGENNSKSPFELAEIFYKNQKAIGNLFEVFNKKINHFIYFSTIDVYGDINHEETIINESTEANPNSVYSHVKYQGELVTQINAINLDIYFNVFRLGQVYGPYEGETYNRLIPTTINKFMKNEVMKLWVEENTTRQYISPIEIMGFILEQLILCYTNKRNALNVVGEPIRIVEIVELCQKLINSGSYEISSTGDQSTYSSHIIPSNLICIKKMIGDSKLNLVENNLQKEILIQAKSKIQ